MKLLSVPLEVSGKMSHWATDQNVTEHIAGSNWPIWLSPCIIQHGGPNCAQCCTKCQILETCLLTRVASTLISALVSVHVADSTSLHDNRVLGHQSEHLSADKKPVQAKKVSDFK